MDLSSEPKHVLQLYGAEPGKPSFANNCLLAAGCWSAACGSWSCSMRPGTNTAI